MRALTPTGRPGRLAEITDVDAPRPAAHEALVRVRTFSLSRLDLLCLSAPGTRYRPGIDAVGHVERPAADGSGPAAGVRVVLHLPSGGAAAQLVAAPTARLTPVPAGVDSPAAAALPLAGLMARRLLTEAGPLTGRRLLVTGADGGVGGLLAQLAVAGGAEVSAVVTERTARQYLAALGVRVVHDVDSLPPGGFDIVLESVGGALGSTTSRALRAGGRILWFGQTGGEPLTLDFFGLLDGGPPLTLRHFARPAAGEATDAREVAGLLYLAAEGRLRVEIGHRGHWGETAAVLEDMAHGRLSGKAVLTVG
ncbi:zinc-binding dehydrogenase [Streptomyces sp. QH1-20]|uniref:zinc-binding dehydrogenase n=1 Tax=Streptomyces sp. QH1-20 TaxID=3240934 RepID=UPI003518F988